MSRAPSTNEKSLSTVGPSPTRDAADNLGGVFRLDALSPGSDGGTSDSHAGGGNRLSTQTLLLAVLLAGGVGLVYGMRVLGVGSLKNEADASVPEYDLARTGVNKTAEHKRAIEELNANHVSTQVPADQVWKNPFRMAEALAKASAPTAPGEDPSVKALERLKHDTEARKKRRRRGQTPEEKETANEFAERLKRHGGRSQ